VPFVDPQANRPLLATVSRQWQWAIERQSFRHIYVKSTELEIFQEFVTGHRRRFVRSVRYTIILPDYTDEAATQFEREADRQTNNVAFTAALYGLFQILQSWGTSSDSGSPYSIEVRIEDIYFPMDYGRRDLGSYVRYQEVRPAEGGDGETASPRDLLHHRYIHSSLCLIQSTDLPVVPAVRSFNVNSFRLYGRTIAPESVLEIAAKLPNLRRCWLGLRHGSIRYPALHRARRVILTHALERVALPNSIEQLRMAMLPNIITNQSWHPPRVVDHGTGCDPLSRALWKATAYLPCLTTLDIGGLIDRSLFGSDIPNTVIQPFW